MPVQELKGIIDTYLSRAFSLLCLRPNWSFMRTGKQERLLQMAFEDICEEEMGQLGHVAIM